jgi:hypothetical protein
MGLTPYVVAWTILAAAVLTLLLSRSLMALHQEESLHLAVDEGRKQKTFYRKIHRIDRLGEILTAIAVAGGMAIAFVYLYHVWVFGPK